MEHTFRGKWISNATFANLRARNVFHRQLEKDTKWNTSLFHLTMSYAAVFLADADLKQLFD